MPGESKFSRRNLLKAFASTPVLGMFGASVWFDKSVNKSGKKSIAPGFEGVEQVEIPGFPLQSPSETIRLGIIGLGDRGEYLLRAAGMAHPSWIDSRKKMAKENPMNTNLKDFLDQPDLNIELVAVCDVFKNRLDRGKEIAACEVRPGAERKINTSVKTYARYQDLLDDKNVDAVIISTPDHWHAQMSIDTATAGKHIYQEKCFARTIDEANQLYDVLSTSPVVYQLGHQNHQIESHMVARNILERGLLGKLSLIHGSTRRNRSGKLKFHPDASPETIDWDAFQEICETKHPFDLKRYFWWRNYFDYSLGQFGDLLSHEYAAINQIARLGIPAEAMTTGGIYIYQDDGREAPDTFASVFNYPDKNLTFSYNLTMGSNQGGGRYFIGKEACMEAEKDVYVYADSASEKFKSVNALPFDAEEPVFSFISGKGVDAVTTATERYFSNKGLYYTYRNGKLVDSSHLHIQEWLNCIRYGGAPSCNKELGYEEAVTCIMASESYRQNRKIAWDPLNRKIV